MDSDRHGWWIAIILVVGLQWWGLVDSNSCGLWIALDAELL